MLSKSFIASIFFLASISSANAHAGVNPALGLKGLLVRSDVQRPSAKSPCGNVNIAQNLDSSTSVQADASGNFPFTITNFNGGADGSRSIKTVQVDATGAGTNLVAGKIVVNGDANPTNDTTQSLTAQLPAGITCTGGAKKNLCLASLTTTAGFGNCVVVSQGAAAQSPANAAVNRSANSRAEGDDQTKAVDKKGKGDQKKKDDKKGKGNKKGKNDATKKGNKKGKDDKNGGKKKGDKKKPEAGKGTPATPGGTPSPAASDGNNRRRSWSSRQMGNYA